LSSAHELQHAARILGVVRGNTDPLTGGTIDADIAASWRRCLLDYSLDLGSDPEVVVLDSRSLQEHRRRHEPLVQVASAEIDWLYDHMAMSGGVLVLTDARGIVLYQRVNPSIAHDVRAAGLRPGADWSEARLGTNGMGTCLAENRPIIVHREEHYRSRFSGLSCTAAPIHNAAGELVAALDLTTVNPVGTRATQMHLLSLVHLSAKFIEKCLFLQYFRESRVLRFHARPEFVNLQHDGAFALDADSRVVAADETALRLLGINDRQGVTGRRIDEIFDLRAVPVPSARQGGDRWAIRDAATGRRFFASLSQPREERHATRVFFDGGPVRIKGPSPGIYYDLEDLAGTDPRMQSNVRSIRRIASSTVPVIIQGATGTGKELLARGLHQASGRSNFVALNCAAIPESLIESELFGYSPGAFTGARRSGAKGIIVQSSGGTLFLDEIGDMPLQLQTRLLRVLEEREVLPLGAERPVRVDLRVISATHQNLRELTARGLFREDLYFRLNGLTLVLPTLDQRTDKVALIHRILAEAALDRPGLSISGDALQRLCGYAWHGNIRELRNVIRAAAAICDDGHIEIGSLPDEIAAARAEESTPRASDAAHPPLDPLAAAERSALIRVIREHGGNMSHAAAALNMSRSTLYRRCRLLGVGRGQGGN